MKRSYLFVFILLLFGGACKDGNRGTGTPKADTAMATRKWVIKDSGMYSPEFLKKLYDIKGSDGQSISLVDSYVVFGQDTVYFPQYFERGKQYLFEAANNGLTYRLRIFNSNYTSVSFEFRREQDGRIFPIMGSAEIEPGFSYAEGTEEDDADSTAYGVTEYSGADKDHNFFISIGVKENVLLATFKAIAKDTAHVASFVGVPTLRCKDSYKGGR